MRRTNGKSDFEMYVKSDQKGPGFWYLTYCGENSRRVLTAGVPERDLAREVKGIRLGENWVRPEYKIVGSGIWPDWMAFPVPLLSARAVQILEALISPYCEFLPWIDESGHDYTLVNTTSIIPSLNWSCKQSSRYGDVYAAADDICLHDVAVPNLFQLEGYRGKMFVSEALANESFNHQLKGVVFVDPSIPAMHLPFIPMKFGRRGTGFIRREDDRFL